MTVLAFNCCGILLYFDESDPLPLRMHARKDQRESVFVLEFENGKLVNVFLMNARDLNKILQPTDQKAVLKFINHSWNKIVKKWQMAMIYRQPILVTRISEI